MCHPCSLSASHRALAWRGAEESEVVNTSAYREEVAFVSIFMTSCFFSSAILAREGDGCVNWVAAVVAEVVDYVFEFDLSDRVTYVYYCLKTL